MSDLVPDHLPPETYSGPYGEYPVPRPWESNSDPGDEQPLTSNHARPTPAELAANECVRLRAVVDRALAETAAVRAINEALRRERIEVEAALGRSIHAGQLGPAVRMALYRAQ